MFTAWRVSHAERIKEREAAGEDDAEEDDTPVVLPSSAVTTYTKGAPVPTPSIKVQVIEAVSYTHLTLPTICSV